MLFARKSEYFFSRTQTCHNWRRRVRPLKQRSALHDSPFTLIGPVYKLEIWDYRD
jgi:hypothetical protein